jgi:SAM-dependent methyltransferase
MLRGWLTSTEGLSILDAGCGDGQLLSEILCGRPASVRLEDISARATESARSRLSGAAAMITAVVGDATTIESRGFDLVLAVGMLDYQRSVEDGLLRLLCRTDGVLIATVPRIAHPRNWLRYVWFTWHGIPFQAVGRRRLVRASFGKPYRLDRCRYDWFVRIEAGGGVSLAHSSVGAARVDA